MPMSECNEAIYVRELSHRTANVLQAAIAAVHLGRRGGTRFLDEAMERLNGAAELHVILARKDDVAIDLGERVADVCLATRKVEGASEGVDFVFDLEEVLVAGEDARRIGMIVSELVGNSIRHAFPEGRGWIMIALKDDGFTSGIVVEDNGVCEGWSRPDGQGCGIVDALAKGIGGDVRRMRTPGGSSRVEVVLPTRAIAAGPVAGNA